MGVQDPLRLPRGAGGVIQLGRVVGRGVELCRSAPRPSRAPPRGRCRPPGARRRRASRARRSPPPGRPGCGDDSSCRSRAPWRRSRAAGAGCPRPRRARTSKGGSRPPCRCRGRPPRSRAATAAAWPRDRRAPPRAPRGRSRTSRRDPAARRRSPCARRRASPPRASPSGHARACRTHPWRCCNAREPPSGADRTYPGSCPACTFCSSSLSSPRARPFLAVAQQDGSSHLHTSTAAEARAPPRGG